MIYAIVFAFLALYVTEMPVSVLYSFEQHNLTNVDEGLDEHNILLNLKYTASDIISIQNESYIINLVRGKNISINPNIKCINSLEFEKLICMGDDDIYKPYPSSFKVIIPVINMTYSNYKIGYWINKSNVDFRWCGPNFNDIRKYYKYSVCNMTNIRSAVKPILEAKCSNNFTSINCSEFGITEGNYAFMVKPSYNGEDGPFLLINFSIDIRPPTIVDIKNETYIDNNNNKTKFFILDYGSGLKNYGIMKNSSGGWMKLENLNNSSYRLIDQINRNKWIGTINHSCLDGGRNELRIWAKDYNNIKATGKSFIIDISRNGPGSSGGTSSDDQVPMNKPYLFLSLINPANGKKDVLTSVTFLWTSNTNAEDLKYTGHISSISSNYPSEHVFLANTTRYALDSKERLLPNTSYQWYIVAEGKVNGKTITNQSSPSNFTTTKKIGKPIIHISPVKWHRPETEINITIDENPIDNFRYSILDMNLTKDVTESQGKIVIDTKHISKGPHNFTISATGADGTPIIWTQPIEVVDSMPNDPTGLYPGNNISVDPHNVTFYWNGGDPDPEDNVKYILTLIESGGITKRFQINIPGNKTNCSSAPTNLDLNARYYWQIEANDGKNISDTFSTETDSTKPYIVIENLNNIDDIIYFKDDLILAINVLDNESEIRDVNFAISDKTGALLDKGELRSNSGALPWHVRFNFANSSKLKQNHEYMLNLSVINSAGLSNHTILRLKRVQSYNVVNCSGFDEGNSKVIKGKFSDTNGNGSQNLILVKKNSGVSYIFNLKDMPENIDHIALYSKISVSDKDPTAISNISIIIKSGGDIIGSSYQQHEGINEFPEILINKTNIRNEGELKVIYSYTNDVNSDVELDVIRQAIKIYIKTID